MRHTVPVNPLKNGVYKCPCCDYVEVHVDSSGVIRGRILMSGKPGDGHFEIGYKVDPKAEPLIVRKRSGTVRRIA